MLLFVNACLREGSRTERLARAWLERRAYEGEVVELRLAEVDVAPLDAGGASPIAAYNEAVACGDFAHPMFDIPKQFAQADEIVLAAPLWNYALPAKLAAYVELACSQGVTFDIDESGAYQGLCAARRLSFVTTAGGPEPSAANDHAFGLIRTMAREFWKIPQVERVAAWGLDIVGADVDALLEAALG
jgi:FMN-dependent NADH-azoreductase